jgi:amino acid adenylation domain-containing protein
MTNISEDIAALSPERKRALLAQLLQKKGNESGSFPLSFAQRRLWFLDQLDPGSPTYNVPIAFRVAGPLDKAVLEQSFNEIVRRHEALRTTFPAVDGEPIQVISPVLTVPVPVVDCRELPESEREAEVQRLANGEARRPFDLAQGPLLRTTLLRLGEEEHVLLLTMHHIVSDGWSAGILIRELAVLYEAFAAGKSSPLSEPPVQYADFARWQRQWLQGEVLDAQLAYWKQQLDGALSVLELPADRPRPAIQSFRGARQSLTVPQDLSESLKALSLQVGGTLFMTLLASFQTLLQRYTGQDDIIVGTPIANRDRAEIEGLIGCFANTLVLRTDLSGNPGFRDLLSRVRDVTLGAQDHQNLPFEKLVEELQPARDLSRTPLFQVMFGFQNTPMQSLQFAGLTLSPLEVYNGMAKFNLTLYMWEDQDGLTGTAEYNIDLFEAATITRMLRHFQRLLESVVANPDRCLSDLSLLPEAERRQLLVEWNNPQAHYPRDRCLHQLFETQVECSPDAVALVFEDQQLTYEELNARSNQLAHYLRNRGVGPQVLVGICLERSLQMVVGILGVLKAGGAYVPLDPASPEERLACILEDSQAHLVLTQSQLLGRLPSVDGQPSTLLGLQSSMRKAQCANGNRIVVCMDTDWEVIARESAENPVSGVTAENGAYVIYTSGSTGRPKGVLVNHYNVVRLFQATHARFHFDARDVWSLFHSYAFDFSVWELWGALLYGGRLVVTPYGVSRSPEAFCDLLRAERVTVLNQTPSAFRQVVLAEGSLGSAKDLPLRLVIFGGEALELQSLKPWFDRHGDHHPALINMYGITETTVHVTYCPLGLADLSAGSGSVVGLPIPDLQVYLLDRHQQPVPIGVPGEIYVGGAGVATGYLNRPQLTADRFIPNPFNNQPGARLYRSGDLARYLPNGNLEYLGRLDDQVKIRGFRVEPGEIESVLNQYPGLRETVVMAREDFPGEKRLVAYVVSNQEQQLETRALRSFLRGKLPEYMVPSAFVLLDALPLTPNGKVDRRALPAPVQARPDVEESFVAPRDTLEFQLTKIWEQVLGIRPVGVRDNFFDLGGHSLMAVRLFARMTNVFGKKLPLATLFQAPTVEQLASILRQEAWVAPWSSLVAIQPSGSKLPFFCVHAGAGNVFFYTDLARHLGSDQPLYALQAQGLNEEQVPHTRVEDMAAHYIKEIRTLQPEGPYLLGGLSFGGMVAFEMAQQLRAQNQKVALLVFFDTVGPGYPKISRLRAIREKASRLECRIHNNLRELTRLRSHHKGAFAREKVWNVTERSKRKNKQRIDRIRKKIDLLAYMFYRGIGRPTPYALRDTEVREINTRAQRIYVPQVYPGEVILFRASNQPAGCYPDPHLGWGGLIGGGLKIYDVPGSHSHTMIREPKVRVVVEKLKACLSEAQAMESDRQT